MIVIYIIAIIFVLLFVTALWPWAFGAAWTPTPTETARRMLEIARVGRNDVVYDLGCGDGRIIIAACREFKARAIGIEIEPIKFALTWLKLKFLGLNGRASVRLGNIFNQDISNASVITVFLTDKANDRLRKESFKKLRPKTRVVTYLWTFADWEPIEVDARHKIYLYEV